jgi:dTDP-4-dehydrorhamnose reductase
VNVRRVLITGGGGQLASDLEEKLTASAEVQSLPRAELDITDDEAVAAAFASSKPDLVLNCAAFHNVELCETEEDRSFEVNARAVKRLAGRCEDTGARLVHFSTNYVFDGRSAEPYSETDAPSPQSIYGLSKLAGEYAALAYCRRALVIRSAGLYGLHGSASKGGNFVTRMETRAREQGQLTMVSDQRLSPTYTEDLAIATLEAVDRDVAGVLHLVAGGDCSWLEFTEAIMSLAGIDVRIEAVETTIKPGAADRPLNGVLAQGGAVSAGLTPLRPWEEGLADYMARAGLSAQTPAQPS